jgi:hypothetical protein
MKKLICLVVAHLVAVLFASRAVAIDGIDGTTVRPAPNEVMGCSMSKPGNYEVHVDDLIELDYSYVLVPSASPKKVEYSQTKAGAVVKSSQGFRSVTAPGQAGAGTIPAEGGSSPPPRICVTRPDQAGPGIPTGMLQFFFDAKKEGEDTVTIKIDGREYVYKFKVVKK